MEQTALVKLSGDLLENKKFFVWLKEKSEMFSIFILIGGGKQINEAFQRKRFPIKFVDGARVTENEEQKNLAEYILLKIALRRLWDMFSCLIKMICFLVKN